MKFLTITLIVHAPDSTGQQKSTTDRFREVLANAELAEQLGFDGFGVGERHECPFISSSPTVLLSHIAALTARIRLFTAVTTLSLLDPVRAYEDYATLDQLSGGRLELIIGKGNGTAQRELFDVAAEDQWDRNAESYEVFRQLWQNNTFQRRLGVAPVSATLTDAGGLTDRQHRDGLELFQSDIAPTLRRDIPDPPWGWGSPPIRAAAHNDQAGAS